MVAKTIKRAMQAVPVIVLAAGLICSPAPAIADGGGGGSTGGGTGSVKRLFDHFWLDRGYMAGSQLVPDGGWNDASANWGLAQMNARHGTNKLAGIDANGKPHVSKYYEAANQALQNARARTGKAQARVVGMGYAYFVFKEGFNYGFAHAPDQTAAFLLPQSGSSTDLPDSLGWGNPNKNSGLPWREHIWRRMVEDNPGTDYNIVVAAVADGEVPVNGKFKLNKAEADGSWL